MLSKEQEEKRIKLTRICVNALLGEKLNEQEISEKYKIPQSTIDRYLKNEKILYDIYKENADFVINEIKEYLRKNKELGYQKGGKKSQDLYGYEKSENGKFNGRKK